MGVGVKSLGAFGVVVLMAVSGFAAASSSDVRLVEAVKDRKSAAVRSLLSEHVDVNAAQGDGATALSWAAHWGDLETAELLLHAGAKVNAANDYGVTPLALACENGDPAMVELLLKASANPNAARTSGETPLMTAAHSGNVKVVKLLLAHGADVNVKESRRRQTALMWAVAEEHPDVVQALIEGGADLHARSESGFTPLLFAAQRGAVESAKLLLAAGEDVNETSPDNGTALVLASASGQEGVALLLLDKGANPNAADPSGITSLHFALLRGLNTLYRTYYRKPAAAYKFRPDMTELVKALLAHGANPNARIGKTASREQQTGEDAPLVVGATPFLLATASYDVEVMRMLMAAGADPNIKTENNTTALMIAAGLAEGTGHWINLTMPEPRPEETEKQSFEAVKLTIELGNDVNAANDDGETPLMGAARIRSHQIIQYLVDKGANVNARDVAGNTPWTIARAIKMPPIEGGLNGHLTAQVPRFGADHVTAALLEKLGAKPEDGYGH